MKKKDGKDEPIAKDYLEKKFENLELHLDLKTDDARRELKHELEETISKAMDRFYTRIDPILIEVENSRVD